MGRKRTPGLIKRQGIWHIDKQVRGKRICRSCDTAKLEEATRYLAFVIEENRQAEIYGVRPKRNFETAAIKFVRENQHKRSISNDVSRLKGLMPFIGNCDIDKLNRGTLLPWIESRQRDKVSTGTINHGLKVVRRILNLAAGEWIDSYGLTWLSTAPKITLLQDVDKKKPYPIDWLEQDSLFNQLPKHLVPMALFAVNTGCRDNEICNLKWEWEAKVPGLKTSVFIIPSEHVKNGQERLVVLNRIASSVIEKQRNVHDTNVFTYKGKPITRMLNSGWCTARAKAGLFQVRVHDLKHTFGRRLRAAGAGFEDRQDLLGHKSSRMPTHYSQVGLRRLIECANKVCERNRQKPELVLLRRNKAA